MTQSITQEIRLHLLQLRRELSLFKIVTCGLVHEEVLQVSENIYAEKESEEKYLLVRKGLCSFKARKKLLGCAHSGSNNAFGHLADAVYDTGILDLKERPLETVKDLSMKIYRLDHKKGEMEKRFALAKDRKDEDEIIFTQSELQQMIATHQIIINELAQFQQSIMRQLNSVLDAG